MRNVLRHLSILRAALAPTLLAVVTLALLTGSASAQLLAAAPAELAAGPRTFAGHTPHLIAEGQATLIEHYDSTKMLRLAISLNVPHPAEESQFLEDIQNKKSPLFHQYLTPEQWDARFAPSAQDEQAIVDWATSQGLTITARYPDRLLVEVEGPAGVIENALHLVLNTYQLPSDEIGLPGETGFSNDRNPVLPPSLNPVVLSVMGLNSFERVRPTTFPNSRTKAPDYTPGPARSEPQSAQADAKPQPVDASAQTETAAALPASAEDDSTTQGGSPTTNHYNPTNIWSSGAYDTDALMRQGHCCNPTNNPKNSPEQTSIAIAAYGDVSFDDISGYQAGFPYLAWNVSKISIDGGYTCNNTAKASDDNCSEVTLDTEWSLTMANSQGSSAKTSKIYVYEGASYFGDVAAVYNQMASDNYARTSSTSWACEEISCWDKTDMMTVDGILAKMAGQGWTQMSASGDQGSTAGCGSSLALNFPASDPNIIAVGGTTMQVYLNTNQFVSEVDWTGGQTQDTSTTKGSCNSNSGGSTGGFSAVFPVPGFQSGMGFPSRANPDISLNSSIGQNYYFLGNWGGIGGTSMSSPEVAGFFAQANSYLLSLGNVCSGKTCATLGNANYPLYEEGNSHNATHNPFYDTTTGCSSNDKTTEYHLNAYCAVKGFDEATGWGTFNMLQLAWTMNWETATANGSPSTNWSGPATNQWYNSNQNVSWSIADNIGSVGGSGTGIAGFTQGWDSISPDSSTQAHGTATLDPDGFYDGPQYTNTHTGCLALASGESCSGGVSQGCHTAHVRAWNNMGQTTGDTTYGPLCYDTVAPTVSLSRSVAVPNSGWYTSSVNITLTASDPGGSGASGIAHTYYGDCSTSDVAACTVYGSPFTVSAQGYNIYAYFTEDNAGNFSSPALFGVNIDETAPSTTIGFSGSLVGNNWESAVTVVLTSTDALSGVKQTTYTLDGGATTTYNGSFTVSTPGSHKITYTSTDIAGNVEATQNVTFTIDSPVTTALSVTPSTATIAAGTAVTLKATIAPSLSGTPTGSVTFYNGSTKLSTVALSGLTASLTTSTLPIGANVLYAVYGGATYYLSSTSPTVNETTTSTTTTTLTSSINPSVYGQYPSFVAVVKAASGASPSGTVTFKDGSTVLATATLATDGDAILLNYPLSVGTHKLTAVYNATGGDLTSTSAVVSQVVDVLPSTIALKSSVTPAAFGATVTFTATISGTYFVIPTGSVVFKDGTATLATVPLTGSVVATYATSTLKPGAHSITAVYSGSANEGASTSTALVETINPDVTKTTVASSLNPAKFGDSVTLTATVSATTGGTPTGTVTFLDGTTTLAAKTLSAGVATLTTTTLAEGAHSITAVYTADTDDATSTSAKLTETIQPALTTTTVTSSVNPAAFGATVKFSTTVTATTGAVPTGTVTFKNGSTVLGTETLASGKASFSTSTLTAGSHTITVVYTADTDDATSTSAALTQVINPATTTTTVASSLSSAGFGAPVTFTATVKATTGTIPTGTVTFMDSATALGTGTLGATGTATYLTSKLAVGTHSITAVYKGTASDATSTSAALTETIKASTTTTTLTSSASPVTFGTSVTFTAKVAATTGSVPTGTVTFKQGSTVLGTGTLSSGSTTFKTSTLAVGSDSITAVFTADTDDATSTSAAVVEVVTAAATTTSIASPEASAKVGVQVTFTTSAKATTGTTPTGTVTFKDGTKTLGTETLSSTGSASFSTSTLAVGAHSITVVYKGTTSDATSTSPAFTETISAN